VGHTIVALIAHPASTPVLNIFTLRARVRVRATIACATILCVCCDCQQQEEEAPVPKRPLQTTTKDGKSGCSPSELNFVRSYPSMNSYLPNAMASRGVGIGIDRNKYHRANHTAVPYGQALSICLLPTEPS
jgi:hypothetical protein